MSNNPFRDNLGGPYQPTLSASNSTSNPLLIPAIALICLCALFLCSLLMSLPAQYATLSKVDRSTPQGQGQFIGQLVPLIVWAIFTIAIIPGSIAMLRLKNYRSAVIASILSVIPLCSPCFVLGIPFGIWALVLLNRPDIKARFR